MNIFKDKSDKKGWNSMSNTECTQNDLHDIDNLVWEIPFIINDIKKKVTIKYSTYPVAPIRFNLMKGSEDPLNVYSDYYSLTEFEKNWMFEHQTKLSESLISNIISFKKINNDYVSPLNKEILSDIKYAVNTIAFEGLMVFNIVYETELLLELLELVKTTNIKFFFLSISKSAFTKESRIYISRLVKRTDIAALKVDVVDILANKNEQSYIMDLKKLNDTLEENKRKAPLTARLAKESEEDIF